MLGPQSVVCDAVDIAESFTEETSSISESEAEGQVRAEHFYRVCAQCCLRVTGCAWAHLWRGHQTWNRAPVCPFKWCWQKCPFHEACMLDMSHSYFMSREKDLKYSSDGIVEKMKLRISNTVGPAYPCIVFMDNMNQPCIENIKIRKVPKSKTEYFHWQLLT